MSESLLKIKENIESYLGREVRLKADKGRKRIIEKDGVVEGVYPSIFIVKINGGNNNSRTVSYSYSDVLTETVKVTLLDE
ncbi:MAG: Veg family protein [Andreesenia angusta]|nr:Veg family protein [Andreesenia angusta]